MRLTTNFYGILYNVCPPILILVAEVWRRNLDYKKKFTSEIFYWRKYPDLRYVGKGYHQHLSLFIIIAGAWCARGYVLLEL